jgi:hypothetical protein
MKVKSMIASMCASALVLGIGGSDFTLAEAGITTNIESISTTLEENIIVRDKTKKEKPSDKEIQEIKAKKEEMRNKFKIMNQKWAALSDSQKEEVYKLMDELSDTKDQILDKYFEFGIIDEATYKEMKRLLSEKQIDIRKDGKIPIFGVIGGRCPRIKR